mmetsp:Transcript_30091/g.62908  ORF Transcript_30091/g.62908 Transcript_30091/m.62908 type:complete len:355 (+) Transcript_30091:2-1066(+)
MNRLPFFKEEEDEDVLEDALRKEVEQEQAYPAVNGLEANRDDGVGYDVVYRRVAIRIGPALSAKIVGMATRGETLTLFEWDSSYCWRKMHFVLRGGFGAEVQAWVLVTHNDLGALLKPSEGFVNDAPQEDLADLQEPEENDTEKGCCGECGAKLPEINGNLAKFCPACGCQQTAPEEATEALELPPAPQCKRALTQQELGGAIAEARRMLRASLNWRADKENRKRQEMSEWEMMVGKEKLRQDEDEDEDEVEPEDGSNGFPFQFVEIEAVQKDASSAICYECVAKQGGQFLHLPSRKGQVIGSIGFMQRLDTFGWDPKGKYRKAIFQLPQSGKFVAAWLLVEHRRHGTLLKPVE